jgi:hypothetical protein
MPEITRRLIESGSRDWKSAKSLAIIVRLETAAMGMSPQSPAFNYAAKSSAECCHNLAQRLAIPGRDVDEVADLISYRAGAAWREVQPIARRKRRIEGVVAFLVVGAGIYLAATRGMTWQGAAGVVLAIAALLTWHLRWPR